MNHVLECKTSGERLRVNQGEEILGITLEKLKVYDFDKSSRNLPPASQENNVHSS